MEGKIIAIFGLILFLAALILIGKSLYHAFYLVTGIEPKKEKWAQLIPFAILISPWFFSKEAQPHLKSFQVSLIAGLLCMFIYVGLTQI